MSKFVDSRGVLHNPRKEPSSNVAPSFNLGHHPSYSDNAQFSSSSGNFGQSAPAGGGPPGGPSGGGSNSIVASDGRPPRDPFQGLLAPDHIEPQPGQLLQLTGSEDECYSFKAMLAMTLQALPSTATACRAWETHLLGQVGGIDRTVNDFMTKWTMEAQELKATDDRMNEEDIVQLFDNDSGGLILFDRHLGKLMLSQENLTYGRFFT